MINAYDLLANNPICKLAHSQVAQQKKDYDSLNSPLGQIPRKYWDRILAATNTYYCGATPDTPSVFDYQITIDSEQEKEKYTDRIGVDNTGRVTCLKNFIESKIFSEYRSLYQPDLNLVCENYLKKSNPALSRKVIDLLTEEINDSRAQKAKKFTKKTNPDLKNL